MLSFRGSLAKEFNPLLPFFQFFELFVRLPQHFLVLFLPLELLLFLILLQSNIIVFSIHLLLLLLQADGKLSGLHLQSLFGFIVFNFLIAYLNIA